MIKNIGAPELPAPPIPDNMHFDVYELNGTRYLVCAALPMKSMGPDKQLMFFNGERFMHGTLGELRNEFTFVRRIPLEHIEFILPEVRCA